MFGGHARDRARRQPGLARVHGLPARRHRRAAPAAARGPPHPHADRRRSDGAEAQRGRGRSRPPSCCSMPGTRRPSTRPATASKAILRAGSTRRRCSPTTRRPRRRSRSACASTRRSTCSPATRCSDVDARERHQLPQGRGDRADARCRQSRSHPLRRRRPVRSVPDRRRQCQLRRRHPFLHRRAAGADRAAGGDADPVPAPARPSACRTAAATRTSTISTVSTGSTSAGDQLVGCAVSALARTASFTINAAARTGTIPLTITLPERPGSRGLMPRRRGAGPASRTPGVSRYGCASSLQIRGWTYEQLQREFREFTFRHTA